MIMAKNVPSLVGERFGRWIVLGQAEKYDDLEWDIL